MKKIKLMLVAFMAMIGVNAFAQDYSDATFTYHYDAVTDACTITGLNETQKGVITEVNIPETVKVATVYKKVKAIGYAAFKGQSQITTVSITKNVEEIGEEAFNNCTGLTSVTINANSDLFSIGNYAFGGTPSLTEISFANCPKLLAFADCYTTEQAFYFNNDPATNAGAISRGTVIDGTQATALGTKASDGTAYAAGDMVEDADADAYNAALAGAVTVGAVEGGATTPFIPNNTSKNNYIETIVLGPNMTDIGGALAELTKLSTLDLTTTKIASLAAHAFANDAALTSLELPSTCATIYTNALENSKVATLTINSVAATPQTIQATVYGATDVLTSLEFKGVTKADIAATAFNGTKLATLKFAEVQTKTANGIEAGAFVLADAACTVTIAKISSANAFTASAITGPATATNKVALTISDVSAQPAKLISKNVGTATVGDVNANFSVDALGDAQTIVFTKAFKTGVTLSAATANVLATKVVFGTETVGIALAANSIPADAFKNAGAGAGGKCKFYWYPEAATKAFDVEFITATANVGTYGTEATTEMRNFLYTTTAVAEKYQSPFLGNSQLIKDVFIVATATAAETTTIEVTKKDGDWSYGKFIATGSNYQIKKEDGIVYSAYTDADGTIYMDQLKIENGVYVVDAGQGVVVKNKTGEAVTVTKSTAPHTMRVDGTNTVINEIIPLLNPTPAYTIIDDGAAMLPKAKEAWALAKFETYNLTWKKFKSTITLPANTFVIYTPIVEGGRLNVVWLDGSEEDQVTAIKTVKSANAENGAIFNLAGQKVNAAYKGVVIKDGKKYIQK